MTAHIHKRITVYFNIIHNLKQVNTTGYYITMRTAFVMGCG